MSDWWKLWRGGIAPIVDPEPDVEAELLTVFNGPLGYWPTKRSEVYDIFGNPGVSKPDPKWERANMVVARNLPGRWNKGSGKLYVHRLAEPYLREALRRAGLVPWEPLVEVGGGLLHPRFGGVALDYITSLGCFNFCHMRHDPARPLSYHSWGIACDINSADNGGKYVEHPIGCWDAEWMKLYPRGVPKELVRAFESVGWRWGGRWRGKDGFVDPMHFELVA